MAPTFDFQNGSNHSRLFVEGDVHLTVDPTGSGTLTVPREYVHGVRDMRNNVWSGIWRDEAILNVTPDESGRIFVNEVEYRDARDYVYHHFGHAFLFSVNENFE